MWNYGLLHQQHSDLILGGAGGYLLEEALASALLAAMAVNKDGSTEFTVWLMPDGGGERVKMFLPPFLQKASSPWRWS